MDLPSFDTRPNNPLFGPLSMWLMGDNPLDPEERPETWSAFAEALGVSESKLMSIRHSKSFRLFHSEHSSNLDEIVIRRREMLNNLYVLGSSGNVPAMGAYLSHTKNAEALSQAGRVDPRDLSPDEAAGMTDEELAALSGQVPPPD